MALASFTSTQAFVGTHNTLRPEDAESLNLEQLLCRQAYSPMLVQIYTHNLVQQRILTEHRCMATTETNHAPSLPDQMSSVSSSVIWESTLAHQHHGSRISHHCIWVGICTCQCSFGARHHNCPPSCRQRWSEYFRRQPHNDGHRVQYRAKRGRCSHRGLCSHGNCQGQEGRVQGDDSGRIACSRSQGCARAIRRAYACNWRHLCR